MICDLKIAISSDGKVPDDAMEVLIAFSVHRKSCHLCRAGLRCSMGDPLIKAIMDCPSIIKENIRTSPN